MIEYELIKKFYELDINEQIMLKLMGVKGAINGGENGQTGWALHWLC